MIYAIALLRASLNVERVRDFLANKHKITGYGLGSLFGAIFVTMLPIVEPLSSTCRSMAPLSCSTTSKPSSLRTVALIPGAPSRIA